MKKKIYFLLTLIFILVPVTGFVQQDKRDDLFTKNEGEVKGNVKKLREISKEINKDRNYNQALLDLYAYMEAYPERFNIAEYYVRKIFKNRTKYKTYFEKLVDISNNDPNAIDECGEIITQMKQLEKDPPDEILSLMDIFTEMFYYKYNANLFETAQQQSAQLTQAGHYVEATEAISSSFYIYKQDFDDDWSINEGVITAEQEIKSDLESQIAAFAELQAKLNADTSTFTGYVNDDSYEAAVALLPEIQKDYIELSKIRNNLAEDAMKYAQLYKVLQAIDPDITDASYIPFMQRFITGVSSIPDSGILGSVDKEWNKNVEEMKDAVSKQVVAIAESYDFVLPEEILGEDKSDFLLNKESFVEPLAKYSALGKELNNLYTNLNDEKGGKVSADSVYDGSLEYITGLSEKSHEVISKADELQKEDEEQKKLLEMFENNKGDRNFDPAVYIHSLFDSVSKMSDILGEKDNLITENQEWNSGYAETENKDESMNWNPLTEKYDNYVEEVFKRSDDAVVEAWTGVTNTYKDTADIFADEMSDYIKYAESFHKGFADPIDEADYEKIKDDPEMLLEYAKEHYQPTQENAEVKKYPELTMKITGYIQNIINENKDILTTAKDEFESTYKQNNDWKENKTVSGIVSDSVKYINSKIKGLETQEKDTVAKDASAKKDYESALIKKENGDVAIAEAEAALKDSDLDRAQKYLDQAMDYYADSLSFMYDQKLVDRSSAKHKSISEKIFEGRNNEVVTNSRKEYITARKLIQENDDYDGALGHINEAIRLWATTNAEENQEYQDLYILINTAINLQKGRVLAPSDPLYAEVSQILSRANICYDEGVAYYKQGNKEAGDKAFAEATVNIEKIRKIYPYNQDVALLRLRIKQIQDPEGFKKDFTTKIADAEKKCKNKDPEKRQEGYNELKNYQLLDPNNKELNNKIYNIEIALGMRQKPVDNSAKTRAASLIAEARKDINNGRRSQALDKLNRALQLDAGNETAMKLKDDLTRQKGGSQSVALPSLNAAERKIFNDAKKAFNNHRYDDASQLMAELYARNKNASKIAEVAEFQKALNAKNK